MRGGWLADLGRVRSRFLEKLEGPILPILAEKPLLIEFQTAKPFQFLPQILEFISRFLFVVQGNRANDIRLHRRRQFPDFLENFNCPQKHVLLSLEKGNCSLQVLLKVLLGLERGLIIPDGQLFTSLLG